MSRSGPVPSSESPLPSCHAERLTDPKIVVAEIQDMKLATATITPPAMTSHATRVSKTCSRGLSVGVLGSDFRRLVTFSESG